MAGCPQDAQRVAERYYWAQLSSFEKAAFELHYLGCPECQRILDEVCRVFSGVQIGVEPGAPVPERAAVHLRLYVSSVSDHLTTRIKELVASFGPNQISVETLHVQENPAAAEADKVMCTPTLVRLSPLPKLVLVGIPNDVETLRERLRAVA